MKRQLILSAVVLVLMLTAGHAQLQQSGGPGSTVTVGSALPTGSNVIGHVVADTGSTTAVTQATGTNLHMVLDSGTVTAVTAISNALPAGTNVLGTVNVIPKTACGNTVASVGLSAVPTSSTLATSAATTCVVAVVMNNTTGSALTVTVTDNTGTPINDVLTFSIPANSQLIQPLYGIAFNLGVKWAASNSGVTGGLIGYQ